MRRSNIESFRSNRGVYQPGKTEAFLCPSAGPFRERVFSNFADRVLSEKRDRVFVEPLDVRFQFRRQPIELLVGSDVNGSLLLSLSECSRRPECEDASSQGGPCAGASGGGIKTFGRHAVACRFEAPTR